METSLVFHGSAIAVSYKIRYYGARGENNKMYPDNFSGSDTLLSLSVESSRWLIKEVNMDAEVKVLFDEHKLRNVISAWVAKGEFKATDLYDRVAEFTNSEVKKNVRDALGMVEMASHPEIGRVMTEGEEQALGWGWNAACDWHRKRIDEVMKVYHE